MVLYLEEGGQGLGFGEDRVGQVQARGLDPDSQHAQHSYTAVLELYGTVLAELAGILGEVEGVEEAAGLDVNTWKETKKKE